MNIPTMIALGVIALAAASLAGLLAFRASFVRTDIRIDKNKTYRLGDRLWGELRMTGLQDVSMGPVILYLSCTADREGADERTYIETIYETRLLLQDEMVLSKGEQYVQTFNFDLPQLDELAVHSPARPEELSPEQDLGDVYAHMASGGSFSLETPSDNHPVAAYLSQLFDKKRRSSCHWQVRVSTGLENGPDVAVVSRLSVRGFGHLYRMSA